MYQDMLLDVYNNISTHINFALVVEFHEKIIDKCQLLYFICILRVREFLVFIQFYSIALHLPLHCRVHFFYLLLLCD